MTQSLINTARPSNNRCTQSTAHNAYLPRPRCNLLLNFNRSPPTRSQGRNYSEWRGVPRTFIYSGSVIFFMHLTAHSFSLFSSRCSSAGSGCRTPATNLESENACGLCIGVRKGSQTLHQSPLWFSSFHGHMSIFLRQQDTKKGSSSQTDFSYLVPPSSPLQPTPLCVIIQVGVVFPSPCNSRTAPPAVEFAAAASGSHRQSFALGRQRTAFRGKDFCVIALANCRSSWCVDSFLLYPTCYSVTLDNMIPPVKSLVRYDKEVLVSTSKKGASGKDKLAKSGLKKSLPPVDPKASAQSQTEDILNSILPPRYDAVLPLS